MKGEGIMNEKKVTEEKILKGASGMLMLLVSIFVMLASVPVFIWGGVYAAGVHRYTGAVLAVSVTLGILLISCFAD